MGRFRFVGYVVAALCGTALIAADDLARQSDSFDDAASLGAWQQLHTVERWAYNPWQSVQVSGGALTVEPRPSASYQDYRPPMMYKTVKGDFVLTAQVTVTGRDGRSAPGQPWSLGGLIARWQRVDVPDTREAGGENYLLLTLGATGRGGEYHVESKSTVNSRSELKARDWRSDGRATLRLVRVGDHFIMFARPVGGPWMVVQRHHRGDLPSTLQVGLTAVTDWASVERTGLDAYNETGVTVPGRPDLRLVVHDVSFARPRLSARDNRMNWLAADEVPDARLVTLFASDNPDTPEIRPTPAAAVRPSLVEPPVVQPPVVGGNDLAGLSDEFNDARTLRNWKRLYQEEKMGGDTIETLDINTTQKGAMTLIPHTVVWYMEYRGPLVYKEVDGDFAVTAKIFTQRRGGGGAPREDFSLCGIMLRKGRDITAATWRPGGENYAFLSTGTSDQPGTYQLEVKTTQNSVSRPEFMPGHAMTTLRVIRVGNTILLLYKFPDGEWQVRRRFDRPDMAGPLQAGITCYTDYSAADRVPMREHNTTVLRGVGNPDLEAYVDYVRYNRVTVPANLQGRNLADPRSVSDAEIIAAYGAVLD